MFRMDQQYFFLNIKKRTKVRFKTKNDGFYFRDYKGHDEEK